MTNTQPDNTRTDSDHGAVPPWFAVVLLIAALTLMRLVYASVLTAWFFYAAYFAG